MRGFAVLPVLACALVIAAPSYASSSGSRAYHLPPGATVVRGWVAWGAERPIAGATVRAETLSGRALTVVGGSEAQWARTNARGFFAARVLHLPAQFVIVVDVPAGRAGQPVSLRDVVSRSANRPADVNPATTLLALWIARHPSEQRGVARARVQRLLGLPAWHNLDHSLSGTNRYFDGDSFLGVAAQHGGAAALITSLELTLSSSRPAPFSFAPARAFSDTAVSNDAVGDLASSILAKLGNGALSGLGGDLLGEVLTQIGYGTSAQIAALQQQIAAVQSELVTIQTDITNVEDDIKSLSYETINADLNAEYTDASNQLRGEVVDQASALQADIQGVADDPNDPANPAFVAGYLSNIETQIDTEKTAINNALVAPPPSATPLMTLAQQDIAVNLASWPLIAGDTLNTKVQSVYEYWAVWQAIVVELETEYDNSVGADSTTLAGLVNTATAQEATWKATILPQPPDGTFVDSRTNLAWRIMQRPVNYGCTNPWASGPSDVWTASEVGFHAPSANSPFQTCSPQPVGALPTTEIEFELHPAREWLLPSASDLTALTQGWNSSTPTTPAPASVNAWLTGVVGSDLVPDLSPLALANAGVAPYHYADRSQWLGSEWAAWTSTCSYDGRSYEVTPASRGVSATYVQNLTYCSVFSLADGTFVNECVADFAPQYGGCDAAIQQGEYSGPVTTHVCSGSTCNYPINTQFDFFHPDAVLAKRALQADEQYWIPWNGT